MGAMSETQSAAAGTEAALASSISPVEDGARRTSTTDAGNVTL
jgi:hypothetical protein